MRFTARISPWARSAMSEEAWRLADRLRMVVVSAGESPNGPWLVRHGRLIDPLRGSDIDALIVRAAQEITA